MKTFVEGSHAIAEIVGKCKPGVVSAYPITPQTHIVEGIAKLAADGVIKTQCVNVESEHSAASVVLGASATGVRAYTATSSQGLLLMAEVVFNIAGMRLPVVMTLANRAVSAPINIWNDHQDSMAVRDSGWFQFYAENIQEAIDLHVFAFRLGEDPNVSLPVMVCIDGYVLTHAVEVVDMPDEAAIDKFLPPFKPIVQLDVNNPESYGLLGGPELYMETRYAIDRTLRDSIPLIKKLGDEYASVVGRPLQTVLEGYKTEDAEYVILAMGSVVGTIKDVVDAMRSEGEKVGVVKLVCYRPFPIDDIVGALAGKKVGVVEKAVSLGSYAPLFAEVSAALREKGADAELSSFVIGLGGRDIGPRDIRNIFLRMKEGKAVNEYIGLKTDLLEG